LFCFVLNVIVLGVFDDFLFLVILVDVGEDGLLVVIFLVLG